MLWNWNQSAQTIWKRKVKSPHSSIGECQWRLLKKTQRKWHGAKNVILFKYIY